MKKMLTRLIEKVVILLIARFGKEVAHYNGEVTDVGKCDDSTLPEESVRIRFERNKKVFLRLFPKERVAVIQAVFPGAEVEYTIYNLGALNASTLLYVGPSAAELLKREPAHLSEAELKALGEIE